MRFAWLPVHDPRLHSMEEDTDVLHLLRAVPFNAAAFDENRAKVAAQYKRLFQQMGIPLNPSVAALADRVL